VTRPATAWLLTAACLVLWVERVPLILAPQGGIDEEIQVVICHEGPSVREVRVERRLVRDEAELTSWESAIRWSPPASSGGSP
jgi:hypothetical protein